MAALAQIVVLPGAKKIELLAAVRTAVAKRAVHGRPIIVIDTDERSEKSLSAQSDHTVVFLGSCPVDVLPATRYIWLAQEARTAEECTFERTFRDSGFVAESSAEICRWLSAAYRSLAEAEETMRQVRDAQLAEWAATMAKK